MIGSHNSFTYLPGQNVAVNAVSAFWRCQSHTIKEQYDAGVRVFDVRVVLEKSKGVNWWRVSHGLAKVDQKFISLRSILSYFNDQYPCSLVRIMLEEGGNDNSIVTIFKNEVNKIIETNMRNCVWQMVIKKPWKVLYDCGRFKTYHDDACHLFNWNVNQSLAWNIKNFDWSFKSSSIKKYAKSHNPAIITKEMVEDPTTLWFYDYIPGYPEKDMIAPKY